MLTGGVFTSLLVFFKQDLTLVDPLDVTAPSGSSIVRSLALVRPCLGLFPFVLTFHSFGFPTPFLLLSLSVSFPCFTLAVFMCEVDP